MEVRDFGKYHLLDHMGKGGVASVYRARDGEDGAIVAVKIFESGPERSAEESGNLRDREVRMLRAVQHSNIVKYLESGEVGDDYFYAMEFVEVSLLKRMRGKGDFDLIDKVFILRQTCNALAAIHRHGIVHRDVKPGNILLDQDPGGAIHVRLTDFGIAKDVSETDIVREESSAHVPGTLKYLSPEQIGLQPVDGRSDIFSLGVVAYELLTGSPPFEAENTEEYLAANSEQTQRPAHEASKQVPRLLGEVVDKMLAKDRQERYDSDTLRRDLELIQQQLISGAPPVEHANPASLFYEPEEPEPTPSREAAMRIWPASWIAAALIAALAVVVAVSLWPSAGPAARADTAGGGEPPKAERRLRAALRAAEAGRHRQVLAVAGQLSLQNLPEPERSEARRAARSAREALSAGLLQQAEQMLQQGRLEEARVVLRRMQGRFPQSRHTGRLKRLLERRAGGDSPQQRFSEVLKETYGMVKEGRYARALAARLELLEEFKADRQQAARARGAVGDLLVAWGQHLATERTDPEEIERYFLAVARHGSAAEGGPSAEMQARLRLELAESYRSQERYEKAWENYGLAAESGVREAAERARRERADMQSWLTDLPYETDFVEEALAREGFKADLWRSSSQRGESQVTSEGTLRLATEAARDAMARAETRRPIRNRGFRASVGFRVGEQMLQNAGRFRVGMALRGIEGSLFEFSFDGASYRSEVSGPSGAAPGAGRLRKAVGDEADRWHRLGVRYDFNVGRATALLDGQPLGSYTLGLKDVRLRLFLVNETAGATQCEARFREPQFES